MRYVLVLILAAFSFLLTGCLDDGPSNKDAVKASWLFINEREAPSLASSKLTVTKTDGREDKMSGNYTYFFKATIKISEPGEFASTLKYIRPSFYFHNECRSRRNDCQKFGPGDTIEFTGSFLFEKKQSGWSFVGSDIEKIAVKE